jgi:hypothetical protein
MKRGQALDLAERRARETGQRQAVVTVGVSEYWAVAAAGIDPAKYEVLAFVDPPHLCQICGSREDVTYRAPFGPELAAAYCARCWQAQYRAESEAQAARPRRRR